MKIMLSAVLSVCATLTAVQTAGAATEPATYVRGAALIDFTDVNQKITNRSTDVESEDPGNGIGVDVSLFHVTVGHDFDETWKAEITTDLNYSSATGETGLIVKKAFVQATLNETLWTRVGSADMPWLSIAEPVYGYRFVEKALTDLNGVANPADWGLHAGGIAMNKRLGYAVSVVNGGGFKNSKRTKGMDVEARISFMPVERVTLAVGAYSGKRGQETVLNPAENTYTRISALAGYAAPSWRLGMEYYQVRNRHSVQQDVLPVDSDRSSAVSLWASMDINERIAVFARYDRTSEKPNDTVAPQNRNTSRYAHAGVSRHMAKNIDMALAIKHASSDTNAGLQNSRRTEAGFWMQVRF